MSRFNKGLIVAGTFTLLTPAAIGAMMMGGSSEPASEAQALASPVPTKPMQLGTLGRASAVAWISAGHVSAAP